MKRRSKVLAVSLLGATTAFVILGTTLPDPPGEYGTPSSQDSTSTRTVYVDKPVPGPTKTVYVQSPADAACLKAGELAVRIEKASAEYSKQFSPVGKALNSAIKAAYADDQGEMNEAIKALEEAQDGTNGAAQDLAFTSRELASAVDKCRAAQ